MNENQIIDESEENIVSEQEIVDTQNTKNDQSEIDPFFSTGYISMHHQPDDDEIFIGE